jgi:hypothetical protein
MPLAGSSLSVKPQDLKVKEAFVEKMIEKIRKRAFPATRQARRQHPTPDEKIAYLIKIIYN